ncbi:hypothetical protein H4R99_000854 [Coemansia sp. RSA 1722]|nr:hypothetical protein LPJ57_000908 [Coemansia sp. RSA 486]KAJ2234718.1 hypothetical protein IWW45_003184 [Coemansia sp. RSA 485]KAJ2598713.1 hypothetical protein GGF39_002536 [Coemansia sp. RSA 1721]KAJ2605760.1 hypothetical protein H4R99_000854 [Coemansia sp. RSA 1722]KAJ2637064.1 hypothetical protein GGF40_002610 [Coemansia sp. RSA 1286]
MRLCSVIIISVSALAAASHGLVHPPGGFQRQRPMMEAHASHKVDSNPASSNLFAGPLDSWISAQDQYARQRILSNIAPFSSDPSAKPGAICASPSRFQPDYYYTWTRDSALVMSEIMTWIEQSGQSDNGTTRWDLLSRMDAYVGFTKHLQGLDTKYGLAEAKYHMDGSAFTRSWCNGQNDGPALRASVMARYMWYLVSRHRDFDHLYAVIKRDLDFVAAAWRDSRGCDIWEETRGLHFYTLMAQRRALLQGAELAEFMGDEGRGSKYKQQAALISETLGGFWSRKGGHVVTTRKWSGGLASKHSSLDTQVLLASLHSGMDDGVFTVESSEMAATVLRLLRAFEQMYAVNRVLSVQVDGTQLPVGVAVGRYPEDVYNGVGTSRGNPWSLITSAMAEYHYRLGIIYARASDDDVVVAMSGELAELLAWTHKRHSLIGTQMLMAAGGLSRYLMRIGDLYMARVLLHTDRDHTMYEQWTSSTGYGRGAVHLTWSYAAHTSATRAREQLARLIQ